MCSMRCKPKYEKKLNEFGFVPSVVYTLRWERCRGVSKGRYLIDCQSAWWMLANPYIDGAAVVRAGEIGGQRYSYILLIHLLENLSKRQMCWSTFKLSIIFSSLLNKDFNLERSWRASAARYEPKPILVSINLSISMIEINDLRSPLISFMPIFPLMGK